MPSLKASFLSEFKLILFNTDKIQFTLNYSRNIPQISQILRIRSLNKKYLAKRPLPMIDSVGLYTYLNLYKGGFLNYVHISELR